MLGGGGGRTWSGRLFQTGMVQCKNGHLDGSLDGLSGIYLQYNPRVCQVDRISHLCHCCMHYSLHRIQSHITATHQKRFQAEVGNPAGVVMPEFADVPHSTSLHHLHFFILSDVYGLQTKATYSK